MLILAGYQLGWYGYAVLQQPVPCPTGSSQDQCGADGCTGFMDLILPSRISVVDKCIQQNWNKNNFSGSGTIGPPGSPTGPGTPGNNPVPPNAFGPGTP